MSLTMNLKQFSSTAKNPHYQEFPSTRHVPIEWDKLASVDLHDLNNGDCNVEILQEHLNHVAFCRPDAEFKLDTLSGRRNMSKLFRLAQLIIQYLFISQEYMETQMKKNTAECRALSTKYQQIKINFQRETEEAKKIKRNNKNLKETVTYFNSLLSSIGGLEHLRCPLCSKAFRGEEFLKSHLRRKHSAEEPAVDLTKCVVHARPSDPRPEAMTPINDRDKIVQNSNEAKRQRTLVFQPTGIDEETLKKNNTAKHQSNLFDKLPVDKQAEGQSNRHNDVDSFTLNQIQQKFDTMNSLIMKLAQNVEWQNQELTMEKEKREFELRNMEKQKGEIQREYEKTLKELNEKLIVLQTKNEDVLENANVQEIIAKQQRKIDYLSSIIKSKDAQISSLKFSENENPLKIEILNLKSELKKQAENHQHVDITESERNAKVQRSERKKCISDLENYQSDEEKIKLYEKPFDKSEKKSKHPRVSINKNVSSSRQRRAKRDSTVRIQHTYPIQNQNTELNLDKKEMKNGRTFENDSENTVCSHNTSEESNNNSEINTNPAAEFYSRKIHHLSMPAQMEYSKMVSKDPQNDQSTENINNYIQSEASDGDSVESITKAEIYPSKVASTLRVLLDNNPGLWRQMREVVEMELHRKLKDTMGKDLNDRISDKEFIKYRSTFCKNRQYFSEKFGDFCKLRKTIDKEVGLQVQKRLSSTQPKDRYDTSASPVILNEDPNSSLKTKRRKSWQIKNIFRHKNENKFESGDKIVKLTNRDGKDLLTTDNSVESFDSKSVSEVAENEPGGNLEDGSRYESSRPTSSSSLHTGMPLQSSPAPEPRRQSFFENITYGASMQGETESESDSDHEYENVKQVLKSESLESLSKISEERESENEIQMPMAVQDATIRLRKPTGSKVIELTKVIERQMMVRSQEKPAGAIDVFGSDIIQAKQDAVRPKVVVLEDLDTDSDSD